MTVPISPMPDRRPLKEEKDFNYRIQRILDHIERHGPHSAGGSGWDAIVDGNLVASDPSTFHFKGINEAITYLGANGFVAAAILIKKYATGYTETTNVALGTLTSLWLYAEDREQQQWTPQGSLSLPLRMDNLFIYYPTAALTFGGGTRALNEFYNCFFIINAFGGPAITITFGGNYTHHDGCSYDCGAGCTFDWPNNNLVYVSGAELSSNTGATYRVEGSNNNQGEAFFDATALCTGAPSTSVLKVGGALQTAEVHLRTNTAERGVSGGGQPIKVEVTGPVTGLVELHGSIDTLTISGDRQVLVNGKTGNVVVSGAAEVHYVGASTGTFTVSNATAHGSVRGRIALAADFQGDPWVVDIYGGTTGGTNSPYLRVRGSVVNSVFRCSSVANGGGGSIPYQFDVGANKNILDFAGATIYPGAGVDNGAGNLIRVT